MPQRTHLFSASMAIYPRGFQAMFVIYTRKFLYFIFFLLFSYIMVQSTKKLIQPQVGLIFEDTNDGKLPSLTICPYRYIGEEWTLNNQSTFQAIEKLPSISNYINVNVTNYWDSNDILPMKERVLVLGASPFKCGTVETDLKPTEAMPRISISQSLPFIVYIQFHDKGLFTNQMEEDEYGAFWITPLTHSYYREYHLEMTSKVSLNSKDKACNETNGNMNFENCLEKTRAKLMNCNLPWAKTPLQGLRTCSTKEDLNKFLKFNQEFWQNSTELLEDHHCLPLNCKKNSWTPHATFEIPNMESYPLSDEGLFNVKGFLFDFVMKGNKTKVSKEIELYGFTSFVADFGGYLGLLLGASLITIFDQVVNSVTWLQKLCSGRQP